VFTARYALSPYIKQIRFAFKALILAFPNFANARKNCTVQNRAHLYTTSQNMYLIHHENWPIAYRRKYIETSNEGQ
jgi:hypothetical protein